MTDKERIEQLEYEIQKKDKRLAEQYHEIVYLNNKIKDLENQIEKIKGEQNNEKD